MRRDCLRHRPIYPAACTPERHRHGLYFPFIYNDGYIRVGLVQRQFKPKVGFISEPRALPIAHAAFALHF